MENKKELQSLQFIVTGKVQRVAFRHSTMLVAQKLNITGNIKNEANSSVSGIIQGNTEQIKKMIQYLQKGPRFAVVNEVQIKEISPINVDDFQILI
ncbi:MAG: acylphosphatase [Candidatus Cloacimonadota bacterium]|nr:MAG: acylphosphatase [Candidatus Cloacimonadota bacterium]